MPARGRVRALLLSSTIITVGIFAAGSAVWAADAASEETTDGTVELAPISVKSKRQVAVDTAASVTVVDQDEIEDRQADTIADLAATAPGVSLVNGNNPTGSGINIRGFGATGTYGTDELVGFTLAGASKGSEEVYRVGTQLYTDPTLYKQVTVTRGMGGTFEYGTGYIGGLVQLEPIDAEDMTGGEPGFVGRQMLQYSSNGDGLVSSTTLGWQATDHFSVLANYTWRTSNATQDGNGDDRGEDGYTLPSYLVNAKLTFGDSDEHTLNFILSQTKTDEHDVPYDTFGLEAGYFGNVNRKTDDRTAIIRYNYDDPASSLINITANLSYSDQEIDVESVDGYTYDFLNTDNRYQTTKLNVKNEAKFATGMFDNDLRVGLEYSHRLRADAATSAPGGSDKREAFFAVNDMTVGNWTFTPQMRYEHQHIEDADGDTSYDNNALVGGLSARYAFDNGVALFAGAYYDESLPIIDDMGTPAYMTQPQKARDYEAGASVERGSLFSAGDALEAKATVYDTHLWDVTSYSGFSAARMKGIELEAAYSMANGVYVDSNANFVDYKGQISSSGTWEDWERTPQNTYSIALGKKFGTTWDVSWEYVHANDLDINGTTYEGYDVNNLRATYKPGVDGALHGMEVRMSVENIFDTYYEPSLATRAAEGRNIKLSLAKTF